jgi:CspA family cold shock protein
MPVGTVKWYDPEKGFGFVAREDGGGDLFLHHTMVGPDVPAEGDRISFTIGYGLKGERAEDVHILERSGNPPRARRMPAGSGGGSFERRAPVDPATLPRMEGVVRRFDPERGFGFISAAGAPDDVFFHGSVVIGSAVSQGDPVEFRLGQGLRGPRAHEVRLIQRG